jgi:dTDP-4-dehydrorhamnose reductase
MRIAITGTSGLIGPDVWEALKEHHELWGVGRRKPDFIPLNQWRTMDIIDPEITTKTVTQLNPDCVIHLAAFSNLDDCERDPNTAYKANALGTRNLAVACQRFDTELLYLSTDQVFPGQKTDPYTELDAVGPINVYGQSKLWGEQFVQTLLRRFYIVRTALVFGPSRTNFVNRVVQSSKSNETVIGATDLVNSPTYSLDLAQALKELVTSQRYGIYHMVNEGFCNRYALACFIANALGCKSHFIKKGTQKDLKLMAKRSGCTPLKNFHWDLNGFPKMRSWQEAVVAYLQEMPD